MTMPTSDMSQLEQLRRKVVWWSLRALLYVWFRSAYRFRAWDWRHIPDSGAVLLVSNHQSFLDPIIIGLGCRRRRFFAMARSGLFRNWFFGGLIRTLNAIPVERGESDVAAMRKCLRALERQNALLIYPEGTRTHDGTTQPFAPGTMLLIKRSGAIVLPVAIQGACEVWPRSRKWPKLTGRIGVMYGTPIPAADLTAMEQTRALEYLHDQVEEMRLRLIELMG